jgi:hypothetical protein
MGILSINIGVLASRSCLERRKMLADLIAPYLGRKFSTEYYICIDPYCDKIRMMTCPIIIYFMDLTDLGEPLDLDEVLKPLQGDFFLLIGVLDGCDDLYYQEESNEFIFGNHEHAQKYEHINQYLSTWTSQYDKMNALERTIGTDLREDCHLTLCRKHYTHFIPISLRMAQLYHHILEDPQRPLTHEDKQEFLVYHYGLAHWKILEPEARHELFQKAVLELIENQKCCKLMDTGFPLLVRYLEYLIRMNLDKIEHHFISHWLDDLFVAYLEDFAGYLGLIQDVQGWLQKKELLAKFWRNVLLTCYNYVVRIDRTAITGTVPADNVRGEDLRKLHDWLVSSCRNYMCLRDILQDIPNYTDYSQNIEGFYGILLKKLMTFYDQISQIPMDPGEQHVYLESINYFCPKHFAYYAFRMLAQNMSNLSFGETLTILLEYLGSIMKDDDRKRLSRIIARILVRRIESMAEDFYYLIALKKLLAKKRKLLLLNIIYEVVDKSISLWLERQNILHFYKMLDYKKVDGLLERPIKKVSLTFEEKLMSLI